MIGTSLRCRWNRTLFLSVLGKGVSTGSYPTSSTGVSRGPKVPRPSPLSPYTIGLTTSAVTRTETVTGCFSRVVYFFNYFVLPNPLYVGPRNTSHTTWRLNLPWTGGLILLTWNSDPSLRTQTLLVRRLHPNLLWGLVSLWSISTHGSGTLSFGPSRYSKPNF